MYHLQQQLIMEAEAQSQFVQRVSRYPVVSSTFEQVSTLYGRCKDANKLLKYTLEMAESGVLMVSNTAMPFVQKLEKPISSANLVACSQLDILEEKYPIIRKPMKVVVEETKKFYDSNIKPSVDKVGVVAQYGVDTYSGVKNYGVGKVHDVTQYSLDKATLVCDYSYEKVNAALATPYGQVVAGKLDTALDYAEDYMDKYLPGEPSEQSLNDLNKAEKSDPLKRAVQVSDKARRRMFNRAINDLQNIQKRTRETLEKLNFTVNLIDYARLNMDNLNTQVTTTVRSTREKMWQLWDDVRKEEDSEEVQDSEKQKTFEYQAIRVGRHLTQQVRLGLYSFNEITIPEHVTEQMNKAKQYSTDLLESFRKATNVDDLSKLVLDQAKTKVAYIQETMVFVTEAAINAWPLNQLITPAVQPVNVVVEVKVNKQQTE